MWKLSVTVVVAGKSLRMDIIKSPRATSHAEQRLYVQIIAQLALIILASILRQERQKLGLLIWRSGLDPEKYSNSVVRQMRV